MPWAISHAEVEPVGLRLVLLFAVQYVPASYPWCRRAGHRAALRAACHTRVQTQSCACFSTQATSLVLRQACSVFRDPFFQDIAMFPKKKCGVASCMRTSFMPRAGCICSQRDSPMHAAVTTAYKRSIGHSTYISVWKSCSCKSWSSLMSRVAAHTSICILSAWMNIYCL